MKYLKLLKNNHKKLNFYNPLHWKKMYCNHKEMVKLTNGKSFREQLMRNYLNG